MNENFFNRLCLALALLGLISLSLLSVYSLPEKKELSELAGEKTGALVEVKGVIEELRAFKKNLFFELTDGNTSVKAVLFNASDEIKERLAEGVEARVQAKLQEFKGSKELIVSRVIDD
ncbi:OB-fold nucleic acid binding domain-containing protein [archaeon]|nr:OB-fold nucleic acid binding domain-containing protein [archaeon]